VDGKAGLIHEEPPLYESWLKYVVGGILAFTLLPGLIMISFDLGGACVMLGLTIFDALLFYAIIPRRLQVYRDRLRIALGSPFALNLPFATIKEAREASGLRAYLYWGVRFATSSKNVVEIVRSRGLNVVISPSCMDTFLESLNRALEEARQPGC
jgi:hypothetical protein